MTPDQYEQLVADVLASEGWAASVIGQIGDHGLDVIAERDGRRIGVQVKCWSGASRKINAHLVMAVYGAAAFHDCGHAMIATDAAVLPDAQLVADKLGVEIRHIQPTSQAGTSQWTGPEKLTFDHVWTNHVMPLAGSTLRRKNGTTNQILLVDGGGITRKTSNGRTQRIDIEIFRWAIERLLDGQTVTREQINEHYEGRASSGVMLLLAALPVFESVLVSGRQAVRMCGA